MLASVATAPSRPDQSTSCSARRSVDDAIRRLRQGRRAAPRRSSPAVSRKAAEAGKARQAAPRRGGARGRRPPHRPEQPRRLQYPLAADALGQRRARARAPAQGPHRPRLAVGRHDRRARQSRGEARGIAFSSLVSIGNECDLSVGEIADMLVDDPDTDVILLFLETMRDPGGVARHGAPGSRGGQARCWPTCSAAPTLGQAAGAIAHGRHGRREPRARRLPGRHGIMRRRHLREPDRGAAARARAARPPRASRVAVATTTGGAAALVADRLGDARHRGRAGRPSS